MIELSNRVAQTIQPGQVVVFDRVVTRAGSGECWNRQLPNSVKLSRNNVYSLEFHGNVSTPTAGTPMQLAIAVGGQPLVETAMNSTPSTANALNNIGTRTMFQVCCCDMDRVTVMNTGAVPVTLAPNPSFIVSSAGCGR